MIEAGGRINRDKHNLCILGDFKLDYSDTRERKKSMTIEDKLDLKQIIDKKSRVTQNTATSIDLTFKDLIDIKECGTLNINMSDHLPVYVIKRKSRKKILKHHVYGRSYKNYDVR